MARAARAVKPALCSWGVHGHPLVRRPARPQVPRADATGRADRPADARRHRRRQVHQRGQAPAVRPAGGALRRAAGRDPRRRVGAGGPRARRRRRAAAAPRRPGGAPAAAARRGPQAHGAPLPPEAAGGADRGLLRGAGAGDAGWPPGSARRRDGPARGGSRARDRRSAGPPAAPGGAACAHAAARRARLLAGRLVPVLWAGQLDPRRLSRNEAGRGARARPLRADRAGLMGALLAALIAAAAIPVLQATQAPQLVAEAAGNESRPVVLHFWATWCEACRDEFPALRPGLLKLPARGVGVLLVSYRLLALRAVLLDAPDPEPVLRAVGEPKWDGTLPATFVFDSTGKLRKSFVGRAEPAALEAAIRSVTR